MARRPLAGHPSDPHPGRGPDRLPPSPPATRLPRDRWINARLVAGVLLVLVSVLAGARVVAAADRSVQVWAVRVDLAAGTTLATADLRVVRVRLFSDADRYLDAGSSPVGRVLVRDVGAGELLPVTALVTRAPGNLVSLPVSAQHVPSGLRAGQRIDVYATPAQGGRSERVVVGVTVQAVGRPQSGVLSGGGTAVTVEIRVPTELVGKLVQAVRGAQIDVAVVDGTGSAPTGSAPTGSASTGSAPTGSAVPDQPATTAPQSGAPLPAPAAPTAAGESSPAGRR